MRNRRTIARISTFAVALAVVAGTFVWLGYKGVLDEKGMYKNQLEAQYQHEFAELVESLSILNAALQKGRYASSPVMLAAISTEVTKQSAMAAGALNNLPFSHSELEKTAKFLSQVGDYAYYLSKKDAADVTDEETQNLLSLSDTAYALSMSLSELYNSVSGDYMSMTTIHSAGGEAEEATEHESLGASVKGIETDFPEYAALNYDGPYSEHILTRTPMFLDGAKEVTADEAKQHLAKVFGLDAVKIKRDGEGAGTIPAYCFSVDTGDGKMYACVSKKGGRVVTMSRYQNPGDSKLTPQQCIEKAREFMKTLDVKNLDESYFHVQDGIVTVNFNALQGDVVCYPDLIKISVSAETGDIVSLEASGYLMNHHERKLAAVAVTREEAQSKLSKELTVESSRLAIIPTSGMHEKLCHEFLTTDSSGQKYLLYVNVETGIEEQIFILVEDENGTLSV